MTAINRWFVLDVTIWEGVKVVDCRPFSSSADDIVSLRKKAANEQHKKRPSMAVSKALSNFRDGFGGEFDLCDEEAKVC